MVRDCCLEGVRALIPISPPPWATKSPQIFSSPAGQSFLINGRMHRVFEHQATLVPAPPGWEVCGLYGRGNDPSNGSILNLQFRIVFVSWRVTRDDG